VLTHPDEAACQGVLLVLLYFHTTDVAQAAERAIYTQVHTLPGHSKLNELQAATGLAGCAAAACCTEYMMVPQLAAYHVAGTGIVNQHIYR
jgi:hypothetical protein